MKIVRKESKCYSFFFRSYNSFVGYYCWRKIGRVKRLWYLSPMRAAKVQASLRIRAVSPEPPLLAHTSSESRGSFRQKARSLVPLNGWACAVKICHDGMLEDTNSLDAAQIWDSFNTIYIGLFAAFTTYTMIGTADKWASSRENLYSGFATK